MKRPDFYIYKPIPEKPGYVTFDRMITYYDFFIAIEKYLKETPFPVDWDKDRSAYDMLEGITVWKGDNLIYGYSKEAKQTQIPKYFRIFSFVVKGSNEGYYFHIAVTYPNDWKANKTEVVYEDIITAKTLCENEGIALRLNEVFTKFVLE